MARWMHMLAAHTNRTEAPMAQTAMTFRYTLWTWDNEADVARGFVAEGNVEDALVTHAEARPGSYVIIDEERPFFASIVRRFTVLVPVEDCYPHCEQCGKIVFDNDDASWAPFCSMACAKAAMSKVWVLVVGEDYEGSETLGVFKAREDAMASIGDDAEEWGWSPLDKRWAANRRGFSRGWYTLTEWDVK